MPIEFWTYESALKQVGRPNPALEEIVGNRKPKWWEKERIMASREAAMRAEKASSQDSQNEARWLLKTFDNFGSIQALSWADIQMSPQQIADLVVATTPEIPQYLSAWRQAIENPEQLQWFENLLASMSETDPKRPTNDNLRQMYPAVAEMTKNPKYLSQLGWAISKLSGKPITIEPGSVRYDGFAFLSFKWVEDGKAQEYALWMNSSNILVEKKMFAPDEYKTNSKWHLSTHTPDKLKKA